MLSPTNPATPWILAVALIALLALMAVRASRKDKREYRRFKMLRTTKRRQAMFRRWVLQSFALFGGASVVLLLLDAQFVPLLLAEVRTVEWIASPITQLVLAGVLVVGAIVAVGGIIAARKETEIPSIGDVQSLLPRNRAELRWGAALSINAGVVEELLFRFAFPAAIFGITGNAIVAIVASIVIFGLLHLYQGIPGIVGSMLLGTVFMAIYLISGSILLAIVVHALFDLRSLVLIPVVLFKVHLVTKGNGLAPKAPARAVEEAEVPSVGVPTIGVPSDGVPPAAVPSAHVPSPDVSSADLPEPAVPAPTIVPPVTPLDILATDVAQPTPPADKP